VERDAVKELVVLSGKGGTGKTSLTASLAVLADGAVLADCDVDAADLHLVLTPQILERGDFLAGHLAVIRERDCSGCGECLRLCRFEAVRRSAGPEGESLCAVDPTACEGCGVCVRFCPERAIDFPERRCGEWMVSRTRAGTLVHARLHIAAENSGKLVTTVRREARRIAERENRPWILTDGPPGIGCPVIASVTGAAQALIVTEPTVSGEHDLERVLSLARHFRIPAAVCVNKWDLNREVAERIERSAAAAGARNVGRVRYDPSVTVAQLQGKAVVETRSPCAGEIRAVWDRVREMAN
jgi:MinD superfamily P-loop ATPase